ncbi:MAG: Two-component transcriptional response regulator, LuxR family, partial [uncultured Nocardioides sp.]
ASCCDPRRLPRRRVRSADPPRALFRQGGGGGAARGRRGQPRHRRRALRRPPGDVPGARSAGRGRLAGPRGALHVELLAPPGQREHLRRCGGLHLQVPGRRRPRHRPGEGRRWLGRDDSRPVRRRGRAPHPRALAQCAGAGGHPAGGRRAQQPGDRPAQLRLGQHRPHLHPLRLPQDGRRATHPGRPLGRPARSRLPL